MASRNIMDEPKYTFILRSIILEKGTPEKLLKDFRANVDSEISQSNLAMKVKELIRCGFVIRHKKGRHVTYSVNVQGIINNLFSRLINVDANVGDNQQRLVGLRDQIVNDGEIQKEILALLLSEKSINNIYDAFITYNILLLHQSQLKGTRLSKSRWAFAMLCQGYTLFPINK